MDERESRYKLVVSDAGEFLKGLPDASVNLIVTSPPYNVEVGYDSHSDNMSFPDYKVWMESLLSQMHRVLKPYGYCCINVAESSNLSLADHFGVWLESAGFSLYRNVVWEKPAGAVNYAPLYQNGFPRWYLPFIVTEMIKIYSKGDPNGNRGEKKEPIHRRWLERFSTNVWRFKAETRPNNRELHPASFPEALPETVIRFFTHVGDTVCDPFSGLGTTALASVKMGRKFVGCDISPAYVEFAERRIAVETAPSLFPPEEIY